MGSGEQTASRRWHDMGGVLEALSAEAGGGAIDRSSHDFAIWEKRVDALVMLSGAKGVFTVDALRRALEDMGPAAFEEQSYYERWAEALVRNLLEAGVFTVEELRAKMAEIAARGDTYGEATAPSGVAAGGVAAGGLATGGPA